MGLIKYVMALMNGARLGIAAQSVGVSQAAYNEGLAYAKERRQFDTAIIDFPAVYDMLSRMKAKLDAGRSILYQTAVSIAMRASSLSTRERHSSRWWQQYVTSPTAPTSLS